MEDKSAMLETFLFIRIMEIKSKLEKKKTDSKIRSIVRYLFCHFVQIDQQWNLSYDWHFLRHPNNNHFASSTKVIFMVAPAALQKKSKPLKVDVGDSVQPSSRQ